MSLMELRQAAILGGAAGAATTTRHDGSWPQISTKWIL